MMRARHMASPLFLLSCSSVAKLSFFFSNILRSSNWMPLEACAAAPLLKDRKSAMGIHRALPLHLPLCLLARLRRISAFILADAEWCWPVM